MVTLRSELERYYADNGLDALGGAGKAFDWFAFGPVALPIPNFAERRAALPYHDTSHVLTGYQVDWQGEFEEGAYEVASGCGGNWFGLIVNHQALLAGLLLTPKRTVAAWRRGAASGTAYGRDLEALLDLEVDEVRRVVGVAPKAEPWGPGERLRFAGHVLRAVLLHAVPLALLAALLW